MIVGCSGSGKTTVGQHLASRLDLDFHELDFIAWDGDGSLRPYETRLETAAGLADRDGWVVEGIYLKWTAPLMERAHVIVWMDVPMRVALWRVFWRHVRAELRRDNQFPGWLRLARFMKMVSDQYRNRSDVFELPDVSVGPENIQRELATYESKVVKGSGSGVVTDVLVALEAR